MSHPHEPWQQQIMEENQRAVGALYDVLKARGLLGLLSRETIAKMELMAKGEGQGGNSCRADSVAVQTERQSGKT